jgi:hypothetical protein
MRYALKKVRRVIINDIVTGKHKATIVEIKSASLAAGQETLWAEGADGVRLAGFDSRKTSTLRFESGVLSTGVIEAQLGATKTTVSNGTGIKIREEFTLGAGETTEITLAHKARGTAGSEIKWIYKADATGEPDIPYAQDASASATKFVYAPETKKITLPTGAFTAGDKVIVDYFPKFTSYTEIENNVDRFSFTGEVFLDGWWTDLSNKADVPLQLYCPAGKVSGAFDFAFGDAVATQSVEIEALTDSNRTMWKLRNYDMEDIDDT